MDNDDSGGSYNAYPSSVPGDELMSQIAALPDAQQASNNDPGSFFAGVDGFNRQFGRVAEGTIHAIGQATNWYSTQPISDVNALNESQYDNSMATHPWATTAGNVLGDAGIGTMALAAGGGLPVGGIAKTAGTLGLQSGILGAASYDEDPGSRLQAGLISATYGAALGAGASALAQGASSVLKSSAVANTIKGLASSSDDIGSGFLAAQDDSSDSDSSGGNVE